MATARVKLLELTLKNTGGKLIMTYVTEKRLNKTSSTRTEVHNEILCECPMYQIVNIRAVKQQNHFLLRWKAH